MSHQCVATKKNSVPKPAKRSALAPSSATHLAQPLVMPTRRLPIQAKLTIGQPNDKYEQEADRVADQVMRMSDADVVQRVETDTVQPMRIQHLSPESENKAVQRQPVEEEEEDQLQAKEMAGHSLAVAPNLESRINSLKSGGQPLDSVTRSFFEPRFGHDFSRVRVHADSSSADTTKSINARAFTLGNHVVMGGGEYQAKSQPGQRLLAHELTHVVQQQADRTSAVALGIQRAPGQPGASALSPPGWLGSWKSTAVHVKGDIWDIKLPSLGGDTWVGPYDQLRAHIRQQGFAGQMEAAHIVGGEHLQDIGSTVSYKKAPCVAVDKSLHATWTRQTSNLQSKVGPMGGRATKTMGRPIVDTQAVTGLYDEIYRSHPELKEMARNIVEGQGAPSTGAIPSGASVKPRAITASGEITVPQRGGVRASASSVPKSRTTTSAEITAPGNLPKGVPEAPSLAAKGREGAVLIAMIGFEVARFYYSRKLSDIEKINIQRAWEVEVAPRAGAHIDILRQQWSANPASYPKRKTYLVVTYKVDFEIETNLVIGETPLFRKMRYVGSFPSTTRIQREYLGPKQLSYHMQQQLSKDPSGTYLVSIVIADPEAETAKESGIAESHYNMLSLGAKMALDGKPAHLMAEGSHFKSQKARLDFIYDYILYTKQHNMTVLYNDAYSAYAAELFEANDPDYSSVELFGF